MVKPSKLDVGPSYFNHDQFNSLYDAKGKYKHPSRGAGAVTRFHSNPEKNELHNVKHYTSDGYHHYNNCLRKAKSIDNCTHSKGIQSAIARSKTTKDMTVYRGVKHFRGFNPSSLKAGQKISMKGFVSTSKSLGEAQDFGRGSGATFHIHVPKGTHALDVHGHSLSDTHSEKEVILPHGQQFKVHRIVEHSRPMGVMHHEIHLHAIPGKPEGFNDEKPAAAQRKGKAASPLSKPKANLKLLDKPTQSEQFDEEAIRSSSFL